MSRDRLLKNSWSYSRAGLTKGVPNGLSVTRRDELAVSDVGLAGYGNGIFECYYFGIVSYFYFFALYLPTFNVGHMFTILDKKRYFEQLFRENYTRLYYYALSFLNDSELARDVVSNAFEAVWAGRDRLEFSSSLVPFVYRLVRNVGVS